MIGASDNAWSADGWRPNFEGVVMKRMVALVALVAGACGGAQAGDFYAAGDIGQARLTGASGSDQGFGLAAGYQFNRTWGAELGYRFLASDTGTLTDTTGTKFTASYRLRAVQLSGLGSWWITDSFSLFGRLGYNSIQEKYAYADPTYAGRYKGYASGLMLGVGAEYALTQQLSLRGEYQRPASNLYVLSAGLKYGF